MTAAAIADSTAAADATPIAFLGGGNIARALINRLVRQGKDPGLISVGEPVDVVRTALVQDFGVRAYVDNAAAVAGAKVVVLAVKPQECAAVLTSAAAAMRGSVELLLSVAAGVRLTNLQRLCPGVAAIRLMPNRPMLVGAGTTGAYAPPQIAPALRQQTETLFGAAGRLVWLQRESDLDVVTALSGSGPAYFFLLAEQMAQAAIALGLAPETAQMLAAETLYGTGLLAHASVATAQLPASDHSPLAQQREAVTSRGGTTEAALDVLAAGDFNGLVARALQAATRRSAELAALLDT